MTKSVPIDLHDITITPVFRYESIEDINASEREGVLVKAVRAVVEVRFAGTDRYQPVFPVDAFWKYENGRVVTYAERWAERYAEFLTGAEQKAAGTPLEMLRPYGITDSQLSLCKALKIYSIEALHDIEGDALRGLQMAGNTLKKMAKDFIDTRSSRSLRDDEVTALREEVEALRLKLAEGSDGTKPTEVVEKVPDAKELLELTEAVNVESAFASFTDAEIKEWIKSEKGMAPRGNPSRASLIKMADEIVAEKVA